MAGIALAVVLVGVWAVQTHTYVRLWGTPFSIAKHAAAHASSKPRALMNYGVLLVTQGRIQESQTTLALAALAAQAPHIQPWDRRLMDRDLTKNLTTLLSLRSQ